MRINGLLILALWLVCFCILNVIVKNFSATAVQGSFVEQGLSVLRNPRLYVAGVLYVSCALLYFVALGTMPLSTAGPIFMILGVVSTSLLGVFFFNETVTTMKVIALVLCLIGIATLLSSK